MTEMDFTKSKSLTLILYGCGFLLLWEWLRPLKELTDTANLSVFIVFLAISFILPLTKMNIYVRTGIKLIYVLFSLNYLYFEGSFFQFGWVSLFIEDFTKNIGEVLQGDWVSLSNSFRSLLFFLLLALMTYLLHYWLINRKQIFIFFFMTLVYITVLDTFTPYEANVAIVRTVVIGFAVMGILTFYRILEKENIQKQSASIKKWLTPLVVMICISVLIGYATPKASPIWPDPVPYIKSYSKDSGGGDGSGLKKVGYGTDDSSLGGPFMGDDTIVYETEAEDREYWKVETKDLYTGKGWISSNKDGNRVQFGQEDPFPTSSYVNSDIEVTEKTSIIKPKVSFPHLVYPIGTKTIENSVGYAYELDVALEKVYVMKSRSLPDLEEYSVTYESPKFSVKSMMATSNSNHPLLTDEFMTRYTQIPETLPQRVKDLALDITNGKRTWFDKAQAVEKYFKSNPAYRYDQKDVAVPEENDDYVDQFIFDTKIGYCDNFSSSMVVMMRSLGIPTRWVKGYTNGDFRGMGESGKRLYVVTNNNAHSWVEVFFPEVGWVPFEPTKGFSNNAQFIFDINSTTNSDTEVPETRETPNSESLEEKDNKQEKSDSSFTLKGALGDVWKSLNKNIGWIFLSLVLIGLIAFTLYKTRLKWFPYYLLFRFKWLRKGEQFPEAYFALLTHLNRYGLRRKPDQTLRDYAAYIDFYFSSKEMGTLTAAYEKYLYKGTLEEGSWENTKELWENLIKKTIA